MRMMMTTMKMMMRMRYSLQCVVARDVLYEDDDDDGEEEDNDDEVQP